MPESLDPIIVSEIGHHANVRGSQIRAACDAFFARRGLDTPGSWMNRNAREKALKRLAKDKPVDAPAQKEKATV